MMAEIIVDIGDNLVETIGCEFKGELVRCKECRHFEKNESILRGEWWCDLWADTIEDDGYCSYGERKNDE